jgi:gamma-glutamyltranspeptidase/glutathione hydrolase
MGHEQRGRRRTGRARAVLAVAVLGVMASASGLRTPLPASANVAPVRARNGMVSSQNFLATQVGVETLWDGGNAVDAAVATAFALAVTHPRAGNIGGGGFLLARHASGRTAFIDFRETAPTGASASMFLVDGSYDRRRHHDSHLAVGVPGTVAGLHLAWKSYGKLPWERLLAPAIQLARDGFLVTDDLARSLAAALPEMRPYPASVAQFSRDGVPYEMGDVLKQPDLARTLERIARSGPAGFYEGRTAELIEKEMRQGGGLITRADLKAYRAIAREPLRGSYRGYEVLAAPPPSSGGVVLLQALNVLEGYDLAGAGFGSADAVHLTAEALRRAFADRARYLGDPAFNPDMPVARLISKEYADTQRRSIRKDRASVSAPTTFEWPAEGGQTTHVSVVDADQGAVALTYTLEENYGAKIVVPGAGFLLNNEMGDFNARPGHTDETGLVGTEANLAAPGKRMLSSMSPTILLKDGRFALALGSPGGRKIPSAVLLVILNVVDFGMNLQRAIDAPRFHHQWLPDRILHEPWGLSPDTRRLLLARGHALSDHWPADSPTNVQAVRYNEEERLLEGGSDRRNPDAAAIGR